jgi:hypothetical protein
VNPLETIFEDDIHVLDVLSGITGDFFVAEINTTRMNLTKTSLEVPLRATANEPEQRGRSSLCQLDVVPNKLYQLTLSPLVVAFIYTIDDNDKRFSDSASGNSLRCEAREWFHDKLLKLHAQGFVNNRGVIGKDARNQVVISCVSCSKLKGNGCDDPIRTISFL